MSPALECPRWETASTALGNWHMLWNDTRTRCGNKPGVSPFRTECRANPGPMRATVAVLMLGGLIGCQCQHSMKAFDVRVTPQFARSDDAAPPVEVNLIGVSDADYARWAGYPVGQYWSPRDPLRIAGHVYVMNFSRDGQSAGRLAPDDPIWSVWKQQRATHLFVVAFLPNVKESRGEDPRRAVLPLDSCRWKGTSQLDFKVSDDRVTAVSKP